ncbi:hypothetical protein [Streptomyces sp. UNOC14_S4]|uniref:hypothetical protein n=1 Tax=Streptomyces sp. UNOC14_S4 TaxID=2872340 RepID=UPI001E51EBD9|nr:hypothetical protein [Streptomyces sp. UNOC14_S4]MCC3768833.1 hypothetical protein [Streptomyces sp. UNOC14_S4]
MTVAPDEPSWDAVLAALQCVIDRREPYGPADGIVPAAIRIGRGKEFWCQAVTSAMDALAVAMVDLPAYTPHLKGTVEALNNAAEEVHFTVLPRYTRRQKPASGRSATPDAGESVVLVAAVSSP